MDALAILWGLTALAAALGWLAAALAFRAWRRARADLRDLDGRKRSQATRYGQLTEQFAPWMRGWPFADPKSFRFLGSPIDGVQFEPDAVYLVEVKASGSRLSPEQRAIRDAVLAGRVGWVEFRVDGSGVPDVIRPWEKR